MQKVTDQIQVRKSEARIEHNDDAEEEEDSQFKLVVETSKSKATGDAPAPLKKQQSVKKTVTDPEKEIPRLPKHQNIIPLQQQQLLPGDDIIEKNKMLDELLERWGRQLLFVDENESAVQKFVLASDLPAATRTHAGHGPRTHSGYAPCMQPPHK